MLPKRMDVGEFLIFFLLMREGLGCGDGGGGVRRRTKHPFVGMHSSVPEILPTVTEEDGNAETCRGF